MIPRTRTISMLEHLTYLYLFPVGIIIAILAISAGISGSNFWIPVYLIWLGLDPKTTFWLALLTMIFGFGSGIVKNLRSKTVNHSGNTAHPVCAGPTPPCPVRKLHPHLWRVFNPSFPRASPRYRSFGSGNP
jgi:hypothetical protein